MIFVHLVNSLWVFVSSGASGLGQGFGWGLGHLGVVDEQVLEVLGLGCHHWLVH